MSIKLLSCCEKIFTHTNTWMTGKSSTKLRKKILQSPKHGRYYWCKLHARKKSLGTQREKGADTVFLNIRVQPKYWKIWTRKTSYLDTFHIVKDFDVKKSAEYHDLYVKSNKLSEYVSWNIWNRLHKLSEYVSWNIWTRLRSLFYCTGLA